MKLVIVESPTKAKTIGRFLGKDYQIIASMGHVVDLPKSTLAIDIEHDFKPLYEQVADKKQIISELKSEAKKADQIILATDPDREGEAIAAHVAELLTIENRKSKVGVEDRKSKIEKNKINPPASTIKNLSSTVYHLPSISRIVFHEITKEAIESALKNPREIDKNLVDAQTARRVLDRLVGYKLSPLLWKKVRRGLSAGRVQSVALRLIVEREREIEKFGKEKYWSTSVLLACRPHISDDAQLARGPAASFPPASAPHSLSSEVRAVGSPSSGVTPSETEFELIEINNQKIEVAKSFDLYDGQYKVTKTSIDSEKKALEIVSDLKTKTFTVADVLQKETRRSPAPPYTTSTLQQDAARRLGINGRRTMSLAQKLYEEGYITYHRTDSVTIGGAAISAIRNFVKKEYGEKYAPEKPRFYSAKQKLAQEAHEAIRPTTVGQGLSIKDKVLSMAGQQGWKLYELIWRRAVASQMSDSIIESTTVLVDTLRRPHVSDDARLQNLKPLPESASLSKSRLQSETESTFSSSESGSASLNNYLLKANGSVLVFDGFLKVNPLGLSDNRLPQFQVSENLNLVDVLEKEHETLPPPRYNDASIIKTLEEKGIGRPSTYATIISTIESRQYILKEEGKFSPTVIGNAVNDFLVKNFSDIDDIPFTAGMEDSLDEIAHGQKQWIPMMEDFYTPFEKKLTEVEGAERIHIAVEQTDEKCPTCGSPLIIRTGRFGKFFACSTFPACKFTKAFVEETGQVCPKDGGKIVIKKTHKGRKFYGCSNYPACTFAAWKLEEIKNFPPNPQV